MCLVFRYCSVPVFCTVIVSPGKLSFRCNNSGLHFCHSEEVGFVSVVGLPCRIWCRASACMRVQAPPDSPARQRLPALVRFVSQQRWALGDGASHDTAGLPDSE